MSKLNATPIIIQQMVEHLLDERNNDNSRFNTLLSLENVRDCIDKAIVDYNKKQIKKK